jgi:hypothetical protein
MARWKLFGRSKSKEESECEESKISESEIKQESEKPTSAEYKETLYTEGSAPKDYSAFQKRNRELGDQRIWRDVRSIEKSVDSIDKDKAQKPEQELEKTVDKILFKRKRK